VTGMLENNEATREYESYHVGGHYDKLKTGKDGYILEFGDNGFLLYCLLKAPQFGEAVQFHTGADIQTRLSEIDGVGYFCFKFGGMQWSDCPFSPSLYESVGQKITFPELEEGMGLALTVLLADSDTGELLYIRLCGLPHTFSKTFIAWAKEKMKEPMNREEYNKRINAAYARYDTTDIVLKAFDGCRIVGTKEDGDNSHRESEKKKETHTVLLKKPNEAAQIVDVTGKYRCDCKDLIDKDMTIQYVQFDKAACFMCDEEGLIRELPTNFFLPTDMGIERICGTVVFMRYKWENPWEKELWDFELEDLSKRDIDAIQRVLSREMQTDFEQKYRNLF